MHPALARAIPTTIAIVAAGGLVYVAWKWDEGLPKSDASRRVPIQELVAPDPLSQAERDAIASRAPTGQTIELDRGAWVQVAGKDGKVAQQYAAERIDPQPGAAMRMDQPRAVFFLEDGRLATLRAVGGRVHVPNRALESGAFTGDVVVRMYRPGADGKISLANDSPALILESDELEFDQVIGSLKCPGPFRLTTDMLTFDGEGLELLLTPDGRTIQRLTVEHPLGPIVIDRARVAAQPRVQTKREVLSPTYEAHPIAWREGAPQTTSATTPPAATAPFYRLELHDDVEVIRYSTTEQSWSKGDLLTAIFTLQNDLITEGVASQGGAGTRMPVEMARPLGKFGFLAASALAQAARSTAPAAAPADIIVVRFTGKMLLEPAGPADIVPSRPGDMKVAIDGRAVEIASDRGMALRGSDLDIDLVKDAQGRTAPALLVAKGDVEATDTLQTVWCGALRAQFAPDALAAGAAVESGVEPTLGAAKVERVDATESVQIQMKDGARVFASSMVAFPEAGKADLAGPNVTLVRGGVLLEGMPQVQVDERARTATAPGGGRARNWMQPILDVGQHQKTKLPTAPAIVPQLDASWGGEMRFVDRAAAGAVLDLDGRVKVRAQPEADEFDALDASSVHLEFERPPSGSLVAASAPSDPLGGEVRPRRLLAKGDARIENQKWKTAERVGEPRLFQVRAETVDYDASTGEALIPCAGSALVYVPVGASKDDRVARARIRDSHVPGGGVEGISRFRWSTSMQLKRVVDDRYQMVMQGSVELVRSGRGKDDTMTLTCDRLEATLERGASSAEAGAFDLGGSAEVKRVQGVGRCFIRTPEYDVECETFDYDTVAQVAYLTARAGRVVSVLPKGQGTPVRAVSLVWDLANGRITVRSGSGTLGGS